MLSQQRMRKHLHLEQIGVPEPELSGADPDRWIRKQSYLTETKLDWDCELLKKGVQSW
jgi:hypothetical protein